ncbi:MAG: riboflavin synthase [Actinomycetota bacterium]|nr:riboflavin synthase [Actinomycetota bacterium]
MFTGIVEELGTVAAVERSAGAGVLTVACSTVVAGARVGDSISVNGCCLTITRLESTPGFRCDLMGETLSRTALGALMPGAPVNLERALRADSRLGGHLVQGHVDGVGEVLAVEAREQWTTMRVSLPAALAPYVVDKGSITIDGTSLTVTATEQDAFSVGLIPHTLAVTVLGQRRMGDAVNLEVDIIAKYVERLLRGGGASVYRTEE